MDYETIIYIVLGLIYLISRVMKNRNKEVKKPQPQREETPNQRSIDTPPPRPSTFNEMLKEIIEGVEKPVTESQKTQEKEYPQTYTYDEYDFDDNQTRESFKNSVDEAKNIKSINNLVEIEDSKEVKKRYSSFRIRKKKMSKYAKMLNNSNSARDAIVLSEILNRRY